MKAKDFLLNEYKNLEQVLEETLRYEYGIEGSRVFYEECTHRLKQIKGLIETTDENNSLALSEHFYKLEELSSLISRIERSSLKEYSWPFLEEFKEISLSACTDPNTTQLDNDGKPYPPQVHVLSEGGLSSYQIYVDGRRVASRRKILTIFFPRTLKHYVLLHPILGHEMGHAIYSIAANEHRLDTVINDCFITNNATFASAQTFTDWLYKDQKVTPKSIQIFLSAIHQELAVDASNILDQYVDIEAWHEEFLCDFIGLLMFGPSFLAAICDLLYSIDSSGSEIGNYHPPTACRVNTLITASKLLGYDQLAFDAEIQGFVDAFWQSIFVKQQKDSWFDVFPTSDIQKTLDALSAFLAPHPNTLYPSPTKQRVQPLIKKLLKKIPPVGYEFDIKTEQGIEKPDLKFDENIDFRDILFAGWVAASANDATLDFDTANKLCEYGILQQRSIKMMRKPDGKVVA